MKLKSIVLYSFLAFTAFFSILFSNYGYSQNYPAMGADFGSGTVAWTTTTDIYTNNATYASVALSKSSGLTATSNNLRASNFGFSIPVGSTINGITVDIDKKGSNTGILDNVISIVNGSGVIVGANKSNITEWGNNVDLLSTYGGTSDVWGAGLTVNDINNSNFGVVVSAKNTSNGARTAYVDYITITITYTTPPSISTPTSTSVTTTTVTLGGNITSIGSSNVTERGIYYSTTNGFADGTGTKVSVTPGPYSTGVFTQNVTGLTPATVYYYKAFCTNTSATAYTAQGTFTTITPTITVGAGPIFAAQCTNTTSSEISYTVSGTNLVGNITITPPANFEISTTSGSGFVANPSTLTLTQSGGSVANTTIYVRFKPTAVQAYSGNITHASSSATTTNVAVWGSGVNTTPTISTPTSTSVTTTTADLGGNITNTGCTNVTERGIYYSTSDGFANGTGTKVSVTAGPYTTGAFTQNVTGLTPSTVYYYKAFCTNGAGTVYTTQGTFTTLCANVTSFPYTQSFSGSMPLCWAASEGVAGASTHWAGKTGADIHGAPGGQSGSDYMFLNVFNANNVKNPYYLTTGNFDLGATARQLKYYYFLGNDGYTTSPDVPLEVEISVNGGSWTSLYQHTSNNSTMSAWTLNAIDLTAYINNTIAIRFKSNSNYAPSGICNQAIDDFVIENAPSCFAPTVVTSSAVTKTTATISWVAPGTPPSNGYIYEVRTSGAAGSGAVGRVAIGTTAAGILTANVTGLSASTKYNVYVSSDCGGSGTSLWASPYSFYTLCDNSSLPITEGFNSTSIPMCWSQQYVSGSSPVEFLSFAAAGTHPSMSANFEGADMIRWNSFNLAAGKKTRLVSLPITTTGTPSVDVEFQWYTSNENSAYNDYVEVQYSTDGTTWTTAGSPVYRVGASNQWVFNRVILPAAAGNQGTVYVGFLFNAVGTGANCFMDQVVIKPTPNLPTCTAPTNSAAYCKNAAANALSVDATAGTGTISKYEWYSNTTATNSGGTLVATHTTAATTDTYTPSTATAGVLYYYVVVTNSNSYSVTSNASGAVTVNELPTVSFTTQPGAAACSHTDVTYTTQSSMSNYVWTVLGVLGTDYSITSGGVGAGSNTVILKWLTAGNKTVSINYTDPSTCTAVAATSSTVTTVTANITSVGLTPAAAQSICIDATGTELTATGNGAGTVSTYSWGRRSVSNGAITPIALETANTFTPTGSNLPVGTSYVVCSTTTSCGSTVISDEVTVNIIAPTTGTITSNSPQCAGAGVTFTQGSCSPGSTCYWVSSETGTDITNSLGSYTTPTTVGTYNVWVRANNGNCWSSASKATGTVKSKPAITSQPINKSVTPITTATFTVSATGSDSTFQWQESTDGGSTWNNVSNGGIYSGVTSATLSIANPPLSMDGNKYRCVVSGACSPSVNSDGNATLTVQLVYCSSTTTTNNTTYINSFSASGVDNLTNNTTGFTAGGYADYTASKLVTQKLNEVVSFTSTPIITGGGTNAAGTQIWVDWNNNGSFNDPGEAVASSDNRTQATPWSGTFTVPASAVIGTTRMRIRIDYLSSSPDPCGAIVTGETEDYTFVVEPPAPMTFLSTTTTHEILTPVAPFSVNQSIACVKVVTAGYTSPLEASSFTFNTTGCTNVGTDIICAKLYFTGSSNTFAATTQVGTLASQPNGTFTFTENISLESGTNYFWLTYDVPSTATINNVLDAQCTSITVDGIVRTPSVTSPAGIRSIQRTYIHNNNNSVSSCSGVYYDDGGVSANYSISTNYTKTFIPDAGKYMRLTFSNSYFTTETDDDPMTIYDGPTTSSSVLGIWSGTSSPNTQTATSATGELTVNFLSDNYATTYAGWEATLSCVSLPPYCATLNSPADNATNIATNATINWTTGATDGTHNPATSYRLYFGTDAAATNIHNGTDIGDVTSWGMGLNVNTKYYWKIVPVNRSGEATGCATIYNFTTAATFTSTTYTVCPSGCDYTTIQSAYNACTAAMPYTIEVKNDYTYTTESKPIDFSTPAIVAQRSAANYVIIRPSSDVNTQIVMDNSTNDQPVFSYSGGAKYITIDGRIGSTGSTSWITMKNSFPTTTATSTVFMTGDVSYNTIKYCNLMGTNAAYGVIEMRAPTGAGIRNITIDNNDITCNTGKTPEAGVYSCGLSTLKNNNISVTNNKIYDIYSPSLPSYGVYFAEFNYACSFTGNSIYFTSTKTPTAGLSWTGIYVGGDNHTISGNYIGSNAALCAGASPLTIASSAFDNSGYGIRVVGTSATSTTTITRNTIQKILFNTKKISSDELTNRTAGAGQQAFTAINLQEGAGSVTNNLIGSSTVGDITVINNNTAPTSTNSITPTTGVSTELAGIVCNSKLGICNINYNQIQGLQCYPATNNDNYNARTIGITAYTDNVSNSDYTHNIIGNNIGKTGGLIAGKNGTTGDCFVLGILTSTGKGSVYITSDTISNLLGYGSGDFGFVRGIHNMGASRSEIVLNQVYNLESKATTALDEQEGIRKRVMIGIICDNDGSYLDHFFVNKNDVYDLRTTTTANVKVNMIGIYYRHSAAPTYGRVFGNKIYSINSTSIDVSSILTGIWAYGQNTFTYNNMIILGANVTTGATCPNSPASTGGYELRGIDNVYGKNEYYFNTINIVGTANSASNSYAYKYSNTISEGANARVFKNNIFANTRSNAGTGKNYAYSVTANEDNFTSDYNYYYVTGVNGVLFSNKNADVASIAAWRAATSKDAHSTGTGIVASPDPLFVSPYTCACDLNITNQLSPVKGIGTTSGIPSYILDDFYNKSRSSSPDIGAVVVGATNPLPVELLTFNASLIDKNNVKLSWTTASEINNDYFSIERSLDGINFTDIASVIGNGNSNKPINYEYNDILDAKYSSSLIYYRLKQFDFDGAYSYSDIVFVRFDNKNLNKDLLNVLLYPNPGNNNFFLETEAKIKRVVVRNMFGQTVKELQLNNITGVVEVSLDQELGAGLYIITVETDEGEVQKRFQNL